MKNRTIKWEDGNLVVFNVGTKCKLTGCGTLEKYQFNAEMNIVRVKIGCRSIIIVNNMPIKRNYGGLLVEPKNTSDLINNRLIQRTNDIEADKNERKYY